MLSCIYKIDNPKVKGKNYAAQVIDCKALKVW